MADEATMISVLAILIAFVSLILTWGVSRTKFFTNHPIITPHFHVRIEKFDEPKNGMPFTLRNINYIGLMNDGNMDAKAVYYNLKYIDNKDGKTTVNRLERKRIYSPTIGHRIPSRNSLGPWQISTAFNSNLEFRTSCIWKIEALGLDNRWYCSCLEFEYIPENYWTGWIPKTLVPRFSNSTPSLPNMKKCVDCTYDLFNKEYEGSVKDETIEEQSKKSKII